jgi:membrane-associated phospholipid phosphatase
VLLDHGHYEVRPFGPDEGPWHSFPSGHTAGSVAVARALARTYPAPALPAYAGAATVAAAQVPCGKHFPADVAAGLIVGLIAEAVSERALQFWAGPAPENRDEPSAPAA